MQHFHLTLVPFRGSDFRVREVEQEFTHYFGKTLIPFSLTLGSPLSHKLFDDASHFNDIFERDVDSRDLQFTIVLDDSARTIF